MKDGAASISHSLKQMRKDFSRLAVRVQKKMDPDDLHDLRVITRRMRAVIWLSRHSTSGPRLKKLRVLLRELGHSLGERRSLDVLQKDASHYGLKTKTVDGLSKKAQAEIQKLLNAKHRETIEKQLLAAENDLQSLRSNDFRVAVAELIVRLEELQQCRPKKEIEWHRLRIEVKKIRYASELLGLKASEIKQLQDLLGKGHDLGVLIERLGRRAEAVSDMKKCWERAQKLTPVALACSRKRLLEWRS